MQLSRCALRHILVVASDQGSSPATQMISHALKAGGDDRARTGDLLRAREALSQLSYVPSSTLSSPALPARETGP
jgi:hypothetical protein